MSMVEKLKVCIYCGTDVTHCRRHKNRFGQYVCLPCRATHKERSSTYRRLWHRVKEWQWRRGVAYVVAAGLGAVLFYYLLGFVIDAISAPRPDF